MLVSTTDVAEFLRLTETDTDQAKPWFEDLVETAHEQVAERVGPLDTDVVELVVHQDGPSLVLPVRRIGAIVSVTGPAGPVTPVRENLRAGIVTVPFAGGPWTVQLSMPERTKSIREAIMIVAAHLYVARRRGRSTALSSGADEDTRPTGFAFPARAAELIAPWAGLGV